MHEWISTISAIILLNSVAQLRKTVLGRIYLWEGVFSHLTNALPLFCPCSHHTAANPQIQQESANAFSCI